MEDAPNPLLYIPVEWRPDMNGLAGQTTLPYHTTSTLRCCRITKSGEPWRPYLGRITYTGSAPDTRRSTLY